MITATLSQPESQLGAEFTALLAQDLSYSRIIFVSAFIALKTILRLRERLINFTLSGGLVRLVVGIDLGGTSREVLEELLLWKCEVFVYHNPIPRATFHPKIYLFERKSGSTLFLGSNNLTDGGLYTNYEAYTRYLFKFPADNSEYERLLRPLLPFLDPAGPTVRRLSGPLIEALSARGVLLTEIDARRSRRNNIAQQLSCREDFPDNPFSPVSVPLPPLLPENIRRASSPANAVEFSEEGPTPPSGRPRPFGLLVWKKVLPNTDALRVRLGSHPVGGVRLTQAYFESPPGHRIDQTTYFRSLFDDFDWEPEPGGHANQEHTFIPMRIFIRGEDFGVRNFEISHKPSGEAGQDNYTTILRWGSGFNSVIVQANLTGAVFSLYETPISETPFFIDITNP